MTNISAVIDDYLETHIQGLTLYNDFFPRDDIEGVISVHEPAPRTVREFVDGSAVYSLTFAFSARYSSAAECRRVLSEILDLVDGLKLDDITDGLRLSVKAETSPQVVSINDKGLALYTCSASVEYRPHHYDAAPDNGE